MKTIDASTVIDFLRRILETNDLDRIDVSSTDFSKYICYTTLEDKHVALHIYKDDDIRLIVNENLEKVVEFTPDELTELFYYFNKIYRAKEDQVYNVIDKLCRYTNTKS